MENNKIAILDELDKKDNGLNKEEIVTQLNAWHLVKREDLPYEGKLWPLSYVFEVQAASAGTVAHYSAMDETNPLSVQAALTDVIQKHIRITNNGKTIDPLSVIHETMRFWFVMLVHTFTGSTTSLQNKEQCKHCNKPQTVVITPYNVEFCELTDFTKKYLDDTTGSIDIVTKSFGLLTYQPVTLEMRTELLSFMQEKRQKKEDFDLQFFAYAPLIWPLRVEKQTVDSMYKTLYFPMTQDKKKFSVFTKIIKDIAIEQLMTVEHDCTVCKKPYRLDISNTPGLSTIFLDADTDSEFL